MEPIIKVENIGKQYRLGNVGTGTLSHDINRWWQTSILGKEDPYLKIGEVNDRTQKGGSDYVWALQDINFEVKPGEILGIIGKNGAGKSTLLKLLSRVTAPTTGKITSYGRIASLLEVGTGFHPELTGEENVYLNGAILGMTKKEIASKYDEIVDFAGCAKYMDTPVKRYSSGMRVRLGFAVAAFLEPDILIVDEVLAVGDAEFQKKAIGKMQDVSKGEGRTVLFVSHNMASVKSLCTSGIVLEDGVTTFEGTATESVKYYLNNNRNKKENINWAEEDAPGNENVKILSFKTRPIIKDVIDIESGLEFEINFKNNLKGINLDLTFELSNSEEVVVFHHGVLISQSKDSKKGIYTVKGKIPPNFLNAGLYKFKLIFGENQRIALFEIEDIVQFEVANLNLGSNSNRLPGITRPNLSSDIKFTK